MRSIETILKALEKRARKCKDIAQGDYCRKHLPPPLLVFDNGETIPGQRNTDRTRCHLCGKPYPPDVPRVTICFEDTSAPEQKPEQKPE